MRWLIYFITTFIGFLLILFAISYLWYQSQLQPVSRQPAYQSIIIPKGASAEKIANLLSEKKLIQNQLAFRIYTRLSKSQNQLRAGQFKLSPHLSVSELVKAMGSGGFEGIWVTFIEGWRREQFALELNKQQLPNYNLADFLTQTQNLEGRLFPDTYLIPTSADTTDVVKILNDLFKQKTAVYQQSDFQHPAGLTFEQSITLASILDREAAKSQDYPIVSGILIKRLQNNWPIQADATLQYAKVNQQLSANSYQLTAINDWWPEPYADDKQLDSPYNTYLYIGLPPAPIANPSQTAIDAAFNPQDSEYWFYITGLQGNMHYAVTLDEHNQNIEDYLK